MVRFLFFAVLAAALVAAPARAGGALLRDLAHVETSPDATAPVSTKIGWPLCSDTGTGHGFATDPFTGARAFHAGLDFPAPFGTAIRAGAPGRVAAAGRHGPYGLMIDIDHGGGLSTRYAHLQMTTVSAGDLVRAGQTIARVGSTGRSKGPHLHFEVWYRDRLYDPRLFLTAAKTCPPDEGDTAEAAPPGRRPADPGAPDRPVRFSWSVCGGRQSGFGYRVDPFTGRVAFHSGLDLSTDPGVAVRASANGRVIAAGTRGPYGNMIEIDHGYGYRTRYGHLQSYNVAPGQMVQRGQTIAAVGSTGRATAPQLHFEIWYLDVVRDPMKLLEYDPACAPR